MDTRDGYGNEEKGLTMLPNLENQRLNVRTKIAQNICTEFVEIKGMDPKPVDPKPTFPSSGTSLLWCRGGNRNAGWS